MRLLPTVFLVESLYFAVSPALARASVEKLNAALDKLSKRGDLERLYLVYQPQPER